MEKTSWFKGKKKGNETEILKKGPNRDRNTKPNGKHNTGTVEGGNKVKSVIFVPHTHGSSLAKSMREGEEMTDKTTGYSLKVVERPEIPWRVCSRDLTHGWSGADCAREKCLLYETKQSHPRVENQNCMKRNVVYETWCETCRVEDEKTREEDSREEAKLYKYIGESARSCYERGWEHQGDSEQLKPGSHMLKHILDKQEGKQPGEVKFQTNKGERGRR